MVWLKCTPGLQTTIKESIVQSFCDPSSPLQIVIATIAFGMGLDSPCVRIAIHWGPSDTVEVYVQESGHSGSDGKPACALLYARKDQQRTRKTMQDYYKYLQMSSCATFL